MAEETKETINIEELDLDMLTVPVFKTLVGNKFATVEFLKKDEESPTGTSVRVMTFRLGVHNAKNVPLKGTQPVATAKRKVTNECRNQIGVFEVNAIINKETGKRGEQYRTINLNTVLRLTANDHTVTASAGRIIGLTSGLSQKAMEALLKTVEA